MKLKPKEYKTLWQDWKEELMNHFVSLHYLAIQSKNQTDKALQEKTMFLKAQIEEMEKRDGTKDFESLLYTLERGSKNEC